jgi:nucleoside-diphosphate-sugar epimerase
MVTHLVRVGRVPVIVVGADHPLGQAVVERIHRPGRELRAFVSSPGAAEPLRRLGVKVAVGDLSDGSHLVGASLHCFSAVLVAAAPADGRELGFAGSVGEALTAWAGAVREAGVKRVIWIAETPPPRAGAPEEISVDPGGRSPLEVAEEVARLDEAIRLDSTG